MHEGPHNPIQPVSDRRANHQKMLKQDGECQVRVAYAFEKVGLDTKLVAYNEMETITDQNNKKKGRIDSENSPNRVSDVGRRSCGQGAGKHETTQHKEDDYGRAARIEKSL
jgi:hypothetical protein